MNRVIIRMDYLWVVAEKRGKKHFPIKVCRCWEEAALEFHR